MARQRRITQTHHQGKARCNKGFTLIEVLIVIAIIGIFVSVAVLNLGDGGAARKVEDEAVRLNALIKLAQEEAILNAKEISLELTQEGYQFSQLDDQQWKPLGDDVFRPRKLSAGITLELEMEQAKFKIKVKKKSSVLSDGEIESAPEENKNTSLQLEEDTVERIYFFSSGEIEPAFTMRFLSEYLEAPYELRGYVNGETEIIKPET